MIKKDFNFISKFIYFNDIFIKLFFFYNSCAYL